MKTAWRISMVMLAAMLVLGISQADTAFIVYEGGIAGWYSNSLSSIRQAGPLSINILPMINV